MKRDKWQEAALSPLEDPELEARRQELVEEFLRVLGGDEYRTPVAMLPEVVAELQATARLLSTMETDEPVFDEQVEQVRARLTLIERAVAAADEDADEEEPTTSSGVGLQP